MTTGSDFTMSLPDYIQPTVDRSTNESFSHPASSFSADSRKGYLIEQVDSFVYYHCTICSVVFSTLGALQKHMNALHKNANLLPFSCPVCGHGFFSASGMEAHKQIHFSGRKFVCGTCGYRFNYKHHLKRHEMTVHKH